MPISTELYEVKFDGAILQRGFWLYVWEITPPKGNLLFYVGRTGDSSSANAQSPFNRMNQHLGFAKNSNTLRKYLMEKKAEPEQCSFRLVAVGPLKEESRDDHEARRDMVAAMEKALAEVLEEAGCKPMNEVTCRKPLDETRFAEVRDAFARAFPALVRTSGVAKQGKSQ